MGTQSLAIILGSLALSDYFTTTNARRLSAWHPPPPPGPPGGDGKWVWMSGPESSSSSSDWSGDGYLDDDGWEGDAHEEVVISPTTPTEPAVVTTEHVEHIIVTLPVYTTEAPPKPVTYPPAATEPVPTETPDPEPYEPEPEPEPYEPEPEPYEPPAQEAPEVEEVEYEVVEAEVEETEVEETEVEEEYEDEDEDEEAGEEEEEPNSSFGFTSKIVGAARPIEEAQETTAIPVGGIIGIAAAATIAAAMAVLFAKKRRAANAETEIDPEENDDLMLEEDMFVGESEDNEIPPPPPLAANEDGIELDESFLHLPDGDDQEVDVVDRDAYDLDQEAENASVASDGLESV